MGVSFQHLFCGGKEGWREREEPEKEGCVCVRENA